MVTQEKKKKIKAEIECGQSVKICVIKDKVSGLFSTPLSFNSIESAKRYFKSLLTSQGISSDDYEMYYLADFSPSTAILYIDDCYLTEPQVLPIEEVENETQEE